MAYGTPPYHESSLKAALRMAASGVAGGVGQAQPGAGFLGNLLLGFGGGVNARSKAEQVAQEYAAKQQAAQEERDFRDFQKQNILSEIKAREKPPPPEKVMDWQRTPEEQARIIDYESRLKKATTPASQTGDENIVLTPDAIEVAAHQYLLSGQGLPMGMSKNATKYRVAVINRAGELYGKYGLPDIASSKATVAADTKALGGIQQALDANEAFTNTMKANAQIVKEMAQGIPETGTQFGNALLRGAAAKFGSAGVAKYNTALGVLRPEVGRILNSASAGGVAQLPVEAQKDMRAILGNNFTKKQLYGAIDVLFRDAANKRQSYQNQIKAIKERQNYFRFISQPRPVQPGTAPMGLGPEPQDPLEQFYGR